jgi:predicted nucleic acid-binding protein
MTMTLFLDACVIIYWIEAVEPFYSELQNTLRSIHNQYPQAVFAVSRLSKLECRVKPLREGDIFLLELYEPFFAADNLIIIELDAQVIDTATRLRTQYNLRTPDALQAACALAVSDEIRFITGDVKFKQIQELSVLCV